MSIIKHLAVIHDPRQDTNKKHELIDVLFLTFTAILSGATGWKSIQQFGESQLAWLQLHRPFLNGIPRRHCIANIIKALETDALVQAFFNWINTRREQTGKPLIAIDGKTLRRTWSDDVQKALHVVSAYDVENGIALYQEASNSKGHEAELARQIIDMLALENSIVTMDALHCQPPTLEKIAAHGGDYVVQLKANQAGMYAIVQQRFKEAYDHPEALTEHVEQNAGHPRNRSCPCQISLNH